MPLALSTGHMVGLGVAGAVFIIFALASSFLFPRFNPQWPGHGLPAFIVVAFVFFFGMLTAVEVFGAEEPEHGEAAPVAEAPTTTEATTTAPTTTEAATTTAAGTTTTTPKPAEQATTVKATETDFKIALASTALKAGKVTFDVKNGGQIDHDLAIKGMSEKTPLIKPGESAKLTVTLKAGKYTLYCSVPGHEAAGMKLDVTVS